MDIASIITFDIVLLAVTLSQGPTFLYIMATVLSRGGWPDLLPDWGSVPWRRSGRYRRYWDWRF